MNKNSTANSQLQPLPDTLSGWLRLLENLHPTDIDMGLERTQRVFNALDLDFSSATIITVAGTNGKGSTCRTIELLAQKMGHSTGVYSSPHITDYTERVRINDQFLSEAEHCAAFEKVFSVRGDVSLTYFESGTLAALQLLASYKLDVIILEVGLGGRLDAVNVVEPDISVITSIGIDHQAWLGDTRELIAMEKAGIARSNKPCIVGEPDIPVTLVHSLDEIEATTLTVGRDFDGVIGDNSWDFEFTALEKKKILRNLPFGNLLTQNIITALATVCALDWPLSADQVAETISSVTLQGRYEILQNQPRIILDVAHNQQATHVLARRVQQEDRKHLYIIVAMLSDKDSMNSLREFQSIDAQWYVAPLDTPRSAEVEVLNSALCFAQGLHACDSIAHAYIQVMSKATEKDVVLVFGSFYTVAEFKQAYQGQ